MTEESLLSIEFIYCACGCGFTRSKYDNKGRECFFILSHIWRGRKTSEEAKKKLREINTGKKHSEETRKKISESNKGKKRPPKTEEHRMKISKNRKGKVMGEQNKLWKGDDVGYHGLHKYVNRHKPKPESGLCEICNLIPYCHLAKVVSYKRDFNNWKYVCRSCHYYLDH